MAAGVPVEGADREPVRCPGPQPDCGQALARHLGQAVGRPGPGACSGPGVLHGSGHGQGRHGRRYPHAEPHPAWGGPRFPGDGTAPPDDPAGSDPGREEPPQHGAAVLASFGRAGDLDPPRRLGLLFPARSREQADPGRCDPDRGRCQRRGGPGQVSQPRQVLPGPVAEPTHPAAGVAQVLGGALARESVPGGQCCQRAASERSPGAENSRRTISRVMSASSATGRPGAAPAARIRSSSDAPA